LELLAFERARIIDVAHHLAPGTWNTYATSFNRFNRFENRYGVQIRRPPPQEHPSDSPCIPAQWVQQQHVLEEPKGNHPNSADRVAYDTARKARSALSAWYSMAFAISYPERATLSERGNRTILVDQCSPTDELCYTLMTAGMSKRLGSGSTPPVALTATQIYWQDARCHRLLNEAVTDIERLAICTAGATNAMAWLTWLRGSELFGLDWEDIEVTTPDEGPTLGLDPGIGCVGLRLLPETKTNRTSRADMYVAYHSASGLSIGIWLQRLRDLHQHLFQRTTGPVFCHLSGDRWTSTHYRHTYLYPWLGQQRVEGDPMLQRYDPASDDNNIPARFFSMGSYRRGGRSHQPRPGEPRVEL